jgi:UDP-N-acetylmuramate dehydrogenase
MSLRAAFAAIVEPEAPLAPFTHLKIGGPAEFLVTPRTRDDLAGVVKACSDEKIPLRLLGVGTNLLVRDEGVRGAVARMTAPCFGEVKVEGNRLTAGGGATVAAVIEASTRHGLAGFETLVGIPATIGGALRFNAGDRTGEMADHLRRVEVMNDQGQVRFIDRSDLHFGDHSSDIDDPVILSVEFELIKDKPDAIVKRLRRAWITRKAAEPLTTQAAARMFKNPRGYQAADLIEKAGLSKARVGHAEISERNGNYVVAHPGARARDVLRLIEQTETRVRELTGLILERELSIW